MMNVATRSGVRVIIVLLSLANWGCDPMYTTIQQIDLQVADMHGGGGVEGVRVATGAKYYDGWRSDLPEAERDDLWMRHHAQGTGTTTRTGETRIDLEIQTVCGGIRPGIFPGFDASEDRVTGVEYMFRLSKDEISETIKGEIYPGETYSGDHFALGTGWSKPR
jgi:hypothetical protein